MNANIYPININPATLEEAIGVIQQILKVVNKLTTEIEELKLSNAELVAANAELKLSNAELVAANAELKLSNAELVAANATLKVSNAELTEKLKINSQNSSLAPSQDLRKPKPNPKKQPSGRKQGGQPGHPGGKYRGLVPVNEVDKIIECHIPDSCENCSGKVRCLNTQRHQVYELPNKLFEITEYRIHKGICLGCKKKYHGKLPLGATNKTLGQRAQGMIGLLTSKFRLSKRLVVNFFQEVYGMPISLGTVSNTEKTVSDALSEIHQSINTTLQAATVVHVDETGYKEKSKNGWAWLMCNASLTFFSLQRSRGKKVARNLIGNFNNKVVISDRYSAYNYLPDKSRQVCWAHLKRDFTKIAERDGVSQEIGKCLLEVYAKIFDLWSNSDSKMDDVATQQCFQNYQQEMLSILKRGAECSHKKTKLTCQNLLNIETALWTFWFVPGVSLTNNQAERQLRPLVIIKKLTFGTQSDRGSRFIERILSVVMSCQQQKKNTLQFLEDCMFALFSNQEIPKLLPA